ncbi:Ion channel regulatory protein UNC-93 [Geosmithia morbida]|uniref:Ion channel regulatory protein UNC-93 n=1 Tax=Geosmithia morbida TaxID=1094350 RepID=A0A9P4YMT1_9HYPO|nr:Ion channel regulatory protein UNC-93 [Geosmithia morbida]KAF4119337.1 Ion channel regulatory protein UNC-93 [Geosmithia morbida]
MESAAGREVYPVKWYRGTTLSAFLVAATAFTCPGVFGALNGMGAGGGASPDISNAANAIVFGVIAVGSLFAGVICNRISPRWTLVIGTLGYAPYAAGFYVVDSYGQDWLLLFGAVTCGLAACFLWVASGAIFMGYSEENRKGFATALKFMFQNLGASIGGIVSLALNADKNYRGSITKATYVVLIAIMSAGLPFALSVPPADKVQRRDGRSVDLRSDQTIAGEVRILWRLAKNPTVVALVPLMLYSQWFLSYQWQFNYAYFTVRSRALNSMLFYLSGFFASWLLGQYLDYRDWQRRTRARGGFIIMFVSVGVSWIIGQAVQVKYAREPPALDWADDGFGLGCFVFVLWGASDPIVTTYKYWLVGSLTNNVNEAAYLAALINAVGSIGSTFGFVVGLKNVPLVGACAINFALFFLSVPGVAWVAYTKVANTSHGTSLTGLVVQSGEYQGSSGNDTTMETEQVVVADTKL